MRQQQWTALQAAASAALQAQQALRARVAAAAPSWPPPPPLLQSLCHHRRHHHCCRQWRDRQHLHQHQLHSAAAYDQLVLAAPLLLQLPLMLEQLSPHCLLQQLQ